MKKARLNIYMCIIAGIIVSAIIRIITNGSYTLSDFLFSLVAQPIFWLVLFYLEYGLSWDTLTHYPIRFSKDKWIVKFLAMSKVPPYDNFNVTIEGYTQYTANTKEDVAVYFSEFFDVAIKKAEPLELVLVTHEIKLLPWYKRIQFHYD